MKAVVAEIVNRITNNETSELARFAYWHFLFQSGHYQEIIKTYLGRLVDKNRIHWGIFIETLAHFKIKPPAAVVLSVLKGIKRQSAQDDLWGCFSWDEYDPRFKEFRDLITEAHLQREKTREEGLVEKFHFLQSQRMNEQAARVLKRLVFLYPRNEEYRKLKNGFEEELARDVISNHDGVFVSEPVNHVEVLTKDEQQIVLGWASQCEQFSRKNPALAYDFAIGFLFVGADEVAFHNAQSAPEGPAVEWLIAELLLRLGRYIDLLEHLREIEMLRLADPETSFAVAYLRAQALQALGQSAAAVELLRDIVQVRPNYRSANHLLMQWSVGVAG